ncbi:hypothetical protein CYG49_04215 [Candidatus Saccharibacteria bacterium]|nr:MAG: hypothetical protein CYG49_04215 [Candidatus Saccharibacteria bacterium]
MSVGITEFNPSKQDLEECPSLTLVESLMRMCYGPDEAPATREFVLRERVDNPRMPHDKTAYWDSVWTSYSLTREDAELIARSLRRISSEISMKCVEFPAPGSPDYERDKIVGVSALFDGWLPAELVMKIVRSMRSTVRNVWIMRSTQDEHFTIIVA